jgi:hypothetical protein
MIGGVFSVRSAYKMLVTTREKREAWLGENTTSSNHETIEDWTAL